MLENRLPIMVGITAALLATSPIRAETRPNTLLRPVILSPLAQASVTLDVAKAGSRLVAVGERGHILLSDNDGGSWRQVAAPVSTTLTAVRFATPMIGWAVGHAGVILHTTDGGESWAVQMDGVRAAAALLTEAETVGDARRVDAARRLVEEGADKPFLSLVALDERTALVFGAYGMALRTDDGGGSWRGWAARLDNLDGWHINATAMTEQSTLFLAGEQGLLLRSLDGGLTFSALPSPYDGSFFGVIARSPQDLVVFGLRGHVFTSSDRGETWRACALAGDETVTSGFFRSDGRLVLTTAGGRVLSGEADCSSFHSTDVARMGAIVASVPTGNGTIVVAGASGLASVMLAR